MIYLALRMTREFHHMKQVDLARQLNLSTSYVSELESGKKVPSIEILEAYGHIFQVPASTFLLFKEQRSGNDSPKQRDKAKKLLQFFQWAQEAIHEQQ